MYGLSGASGMSKKNKMHVHKPYAGRHCCLWCTVTYSDLQKPLSARGKSPARTLATMEQDYLEFLSKGSGDINKAKDFNNVIRPPIFDIPLDMVKELLVYTV